MPSAPHMLYVVGPHVAAAGIPARHPPEFEDAARESDDARLRSAELRGELPAPAFRQEPDIFVYETEQIVTGAGGALVVHFAQPQPRLRLSKAMNSNGTPIVRATLRSSAAAASGSTEQQMIVYMGLIS